MDLQRLFAYDAWANREVLTNLRSLAKPPDRAVQLLGHILGAQWIWLARLTSTPAAMQVWPSLPLQEALPAIDELHRSWSSFLNGMNPDATITYTNTKGERHTSRVDDVVMHLIIHGGYHRGQIATLVRQAGNTPAYTDFIHATRKGLI